MCTAGRLDLKPTSGVPAVTEPASPRCSGPPWCLASRPAALFNDLDWHVGAPGHRASRSSEAWISWSHLGVNECLSQAVLVWANPTGWEIRPSRGCGDGEDRCALDLVMAIAEKSEFSQRGETRRCGRIKRGVDQSGEFVIEWNIQDVCTHTHTLLYCAVFTTDLSIY